MVWTSAYGVRAPIEWRETSLPLQPVEINKKIIILSIYLLEWDSHLGRSTLIGTQKVRTRSVASLEKTRGIGMTPVLAHIIDTD